jgi:hypothetical protein
MLQRGTRNPDAPVRAAQRGSTQGLSAVRCEYSRMPCRPRTYFEIDIEDGAAVVDADCEVVVRAPVVESIDCDEMDIPL